MTVNELLDQHSNSWNVNLVRQLFSDEDIELILNTKILPSRTDFRVWGCSKSGSYDSKSGYKLIETLNTVRTGNQVVLPPIEKQLWSNLWKAKTSPKLRHFLWRVLSGALAVKSQLQSRGIQLDPICPVCHQEPETICHMLFQCPSSREVWETSQFPLPPAGWSPNSVFLNLHYLISCSQKQSIGTSVRLSFPWVLWQIWKARNKFCFEQIIPVAGDIVFKAREETSIWLNLHGYLQKCSNVLPIAPSSERKWSSPPLSILKCNIGVSWSSASMYCGAGWIIRNSVGKVLLHSRRSFSGVRSPIQAGLLAITWATTSVKEHKLRNVQFEFSSSEAADALNNPLDFPLVYAECYKALGSVYSLPKSSIALVHGTCNKAASAIADSVISGQRFHSYVSSGGPRWLAMMLDEEATSS
ncbi:hypothetical protein IGI04_014518 [Brassica rapa subsp. trilocularis]|uniref:Reverse transcriptase zinc-binding domain-containing protein n=1 Tax=Brassica rapa subsp. trilocularis TaxID=1813537 RepID=A0ABQ7MPW5_BRACM|nr:hypothetical protein IGI04_014518 [Brassica rapa subsp. trilocularis]